MNIRRRDFIVGLASAGVGGVALTGCKYVPTAGEIQLVAVLVGKAAGLVCNECKIDDKSRNVIIDIMGKVRSCVPATDETFEEKWTAIAKEHTQILIDEGKITPAQGELIMAAFKVVAKGIDYLFSVRFPKAREYTNLVLAGISGFCDGFLEEFKPVNDNCDDCTDCTVKLANGTVDKKAYYYLIQFKVKR